MADIAKYKLNSNAEVFPVFDVDYEYMYTDETGSDGTIIRTITADSSPNTISFKEIEELVSVEYIDTTNITDFSEMFQDCINLTHVDFNSIDTSNVTDMSFMFDGCTGLLSLDLSGINTGNVVNMQNMFSGCTGLFSLDLDLLNVSKVNNMNAMFQGCSNMSGLNLRGWDVSNVSNMGWLFADCTNLLNVNLRGLEINNTTVITSMFDGCLVLNHVIVDDCSIDVINKIVRVLPERTDGYEYKLKLNLADMTGVNVEDIEAKGWSLASYEIVVRYKYDKSIYENLIPDFNSSFTDYVVIDEEIDGNIVTRAIGHENLKPTMVRFGNPNGDGSGNINKYYSLLEVLYMFSDNISDASLMFHQCINLTSLDVSNFNTSNVTSMYGMFSGCKSLTSLDVSNFDTSKVTYMNNMFNNCSNLTSLDVSNFNTSNVTRMDYMFQNCYRLTSLDVSKWNTSKVTNMSAMFAACIKITYI